MCVLTLLFWKIQTGRCSFSHLADYSIVRSQLAEFILLLSRSQHRYFCTVPLSRDMDATMFQLRSFVHHRMYAAAEEILGEVEKTITLAVCEVSRFKEEVESLRRQPDFLENESGLGRSFHVLYRGV